MKKIVLFVITLVTILMSINHIYAYEQTTSTKYVVTTSYGEFVSVPGASEYEFHIVKYRFSEWLDSGLDTDNLLQIASYGYTYDYDVIIHINTVNEVVGYDISLNDVYYNIPVSSKYTYILYTHKNNTIGFYNSVNNLVFSLDLNNLQPTDELKLYYTIQVYDYDNNSMYYDKGFTDGYNKGQQDGYKQAENKYSIIYNGKFMTATEYGQIRYTNGYGEAQTYYAYNSNGVYLTASEYAQIRFNEGYEIGLTSEIDWFNWAFTFITMPVRILNVEVLPNIKIGYFALFTLMTGIISWFFFIVGKGKGKK